MQNFLRTTREKQNLSQSELAEKAGVSRQTIHAIENNSFIPSISLAMKIAVILNIQPEHLFELEDTD
ncbi:MAG: helix-turn-helix transcriptional regulator [Bacteroidales bacterium]|nr:helix-turn-helix transcriptional regulator [Bacteroidales bacterium]